MVDVQTVMERLEALKVYLAELDHYAQYSLDELTSDFVKHRAVERSLQLAAQAIADIATHIISADYNTRVQDYRQAIEELGKEGVLPAAFAKRLAPIAGFRNILVHEYLAGRSTLNRGAGRGPHQKTALGNSRGFCPTFAPN